MRGEVRTYRYINTLKRNYLEHLSMYEVIIFCDNFIIYTIAVQGSVKVSENPCQLLSHFRELLGKYFPQFNLLLQWLHYS